MKPRPGATSLPSTTPFFSTGITSSGGSLNMVLLMMAAPALVPAMTPPRRYSAHSASSTAVLLPSARRSAPVMRA